MSTAAQDAGLDFSHFEAVISKIATGTTVDDALEIIEKEMYQLRDAAYDAIEGTNGLRSTLTNTGMAT